MDEIMQRGMEPRRKSRALPSPDSVDVRRMALLLDVDGTLLDIATTPTSVVVPEPLRQTLRNLLALSGGALALVSGRTVDTLDRLFAPLKVPAIGGHGAEMRVSTADPIVKCHRPDLSDALRERLHALATIDPRLLIEDKLHSIAVHYRLARARQDFLEREIAGIVAASTDQVEILSGKDVIEVKPKAFTKGSAVIELMNHPPFSGRIPLFIGDDTTDESVFAILPELSGLGFSVGRVMAGAEGIVPSPEHVRSWLAELAAHAGGAP
jgi:trehalose 6-phosphate phosphatase